MQKQIFDRDGTYKQHYKSMCWNKFWYVTEYEAVRAALILGNWEYTYRKMYRAYPCQYCNGWHLTTRRPNITKKLLNKIKREKCPTKKKKYLTEKSATQAANDKGLDFCRCEVCNYWHVVD